jgi:hypothetical protein
MWFVTRRLKRATAIGIGTDLPSARDAVDRDDTKPLGYVRR